jgi:hypothetical protein
VDRPQTISATRSRTATALALLLLGAGCTSGIDLVGDGDHDVVPPADADGGAEDHADADVAVEVDAEADAEIDVGADADDGDAVADEGDADAGTCVGGWYDPASGLCWEDPPPSTAMDLSEAEAYCDALSLGGYGSGSWHLPTIDELRSLIRECPATEPGGACAVTDPWCLDNHFCMNDWCDGCSSMWGCYWPDPVSGPCSVFRSSSVGGDRFGACNFVVRFTNASVECGTSAHARCVRPGP